MSNTFFSAVLASMIVLLSLVFVVIHVIHIIRQSKKYATGQFPNNFKEIKILGVSDIAAQL